MATSKTLDATVDGLPGGSTPSWRVQAIAADGTRTTDGPSASATLLTATAAVDVTPTLDTARTVEGTASPNGAFRLSATGSDGTEYTLDLPRTSLVGQETITMTPITQLAGSPVGFRAGVQLEPSGLRLLDSGTLRIHPPATLTAQQIADEAPATFSGDGTALVPTLLESSGDPKGTGAPAADELLPVTHFSGYVVGEASATQRDALLQSTRTTFDRDAARVQQLFRQERVRQLTGQPGDTGVLAQAGAIIEQEYQATILPLLAAALKDDALADEAISRALGWERSLQLLGFDDAHSAVIGDFITAILQNRFDKAKNRCLVNADVRAVRDMLASDRSLSLFGAPDTARTTDILACATQRLTVTVTGSTDVTAKNAAFSAQAFDWSGTLRSSSVSATATGMSGTFDFDRNGFFVTSGTVNLTSGSVGGSYALCSAQWQGQDRSSDEYNQMVALVQPELNPAPALAGQVYLANIGVGDVSKVTESFRSSLPDGPRCGQPVDRPERVLFGSGLRQGVHAPLGRPVTLPQPLARPYLNYTLGTQINLEIDQILR